VNVWTGQVIRNFDEHVTLDIADPNYYSYQVFAYTIPETVGSLKFRIDGLQRNIDNDAPYKLQNYALHSYTSGTHTLGAVPYTEPNGHGTRGLENTATFTIIDSRVSGSAVARENASPEAEEISLEEESDAFSVYPVPVNDELTIEFVPATDEAVELTIINVHGQPVYHVPVTAAQIRGYRVSTNAIGLTTGAYYVIIQTSQLRKTKKFMKQ
jgi:hypothetical protein